MRIAAPSILRLATHPAPPRVSQERQVSGQPVERFQDERFRVVEPPARQDSLRRLGPPVSDVVEEAIQKAYRFLLQPPHPPEVPGVDVALALLPLGLAVQRCLLRAAQQAEVSV